VRITTGAPSPSTSNDCYASHLLLLGVNIFIYRIVKNFGGEKTLANLANHKNLPTFFANFPVL